jgi:hypothetical protein
MKKKNRETDFEMKAEYDFSRGVRGKYTQRLAEGSNIVVLDPTTPFGTWPKPRQGSDARFRYAPLKRYRSRLPTSRPSIRR